MKQEGISCEMTEILKLFFSMKMNSLKLLEVLGGKGEREGGGKINDILGISNFKNLNFTNIIIN